MLRFGSKALNHWQRSYVPTKLELLGVATGITNLSNYLRGNRFVVECDHKALHPSSYRTTGKRSHIRSVARDLATIQF